MIDRPARQRDSYSMKNLVIRAAERRDVPSILALIRGLAEFEKLSHEVVATEEILERSLFDGRKVAEVLLAELDDRAVGFALFFHSFSTFLGKPGIYLEDLFILPEFRNQNIGFRLLREVARVAKARECGRLEWSVLDWNSRALSFYHRLGAKPMSEWTVQRMTEPEFHALADRKI
jgi:GNAT superfamily N-acetyltransferase